MPTWLIVILAIVGVLVIAYFLYCLFAVAVSIFAICFGYKHVFKTIKEIWNESKS